MIRLLTGDCRDLLKTLPDASVHCVVTSPPYFGLRDYGTGQWEGGDAACDHVVSEIRTGLGMAALGEQYRGGGKKVSEPKPMTAKDVCPHCGARRIDRQIGLERDPSEYLATMVEVFREVRRIMRPDACCFINLGDAFTNKQLQMMPARLALELQRDGWWLRSDIIWAKPNPMPESVTDRPTNAHEHVFMLTRSARYFYDAEAVKEGATKAPMPMQASAAAIAAKSVGPMARGDGINHQFADPERLWAADGTRNLRNVWTIPTEAFPGSHFATMPTALVERCIRAGTSERGCCAACGAPWRRVVEREESKAQEDRTAARYLMHKAAGENYSGLVRGDRDTWAPNHYRPSTTTGWAASCACNAAVVPCRVLDPFGGAGTTGLVASRLQRDATLIELNPDYERMATARVVDDAPLFADLPVPEPPDEMAIRDLFSEAHE